MPRQTRRADRRRDNRLNRHRAKAEQLRQFVRAAFTDLPLRHYGSALPDHVPGMPNRIRRALLPLLEAQHSDHKAAIASMDARRMRELRDLRDLMTPVLDRLGAVRFGDIMRVPEGPLFSLYEPIRSPEDLRIHQPMTRIREIDGCKRFMLVYEFGPEVLRYALEAADDEHVLRIVQQIAAMLAHIFEAEAVRHFVYHEPLAEKGSTPGAPWPNIDELIAAYPENAFAHVTRMTVRAVAVGDRRTAEHFGKIGVALTRRGWQDTTPQKPYPGEKIVAAAIRDARGGIFTLPAPARHNDLIHAMVERGDRKPIAGMQGFMTSHGRFVDRFEARKIAAAAQQLRTSQQDGELFTEDVW